MIRAELIHKLRKGQEPAFAELVLVTSPRLMTVAKLYTNSVQDAQDVLQDAYIICFEKMATFVGDEPKAFYGWMKRITINLAISKNRKLYKRNERSTDMSTLDPPFDADVLSEMSRREIMAIIMDLAPSYRRIFGLYVLEGYSHKEIASMLDISASTSRSQFIRAKRILQKKIGQLQNLDVI